LARKVSIKRLSRHGNSVMITVPRPFLHAMNLLKGDYVEVSLDETNTDPYGLPVLKVRGLYEQKTRPTPQPRPVGVAVVD